MSRQPLQLVAPDLEAPADIDWHRQQMALQSLAIGDILAEVDDLIAREPDEQQHPLFSLVANALDHRIMPGTGDALQAHYGRLIDQAIERLVEQYLVDASGGEDD